MNSYERIYTLLVEGPTPEEWEAGQRIFRKRKYIKFNPGAKDFRPIAASQKPTKKKPTKKKPTKRGGN